MKKTLLLPRVCRAIGIILLPLGILLLVAVYGYQYSIPFLNFTQSPAAAEAAATAPPKSTSSGIALTGESDFLFSKYFSGDLSGELALLAIFAALFMIAFSKQKHEDEYVAAIRLRALQISVYANYIILALASFIIYGLSFLYVMELNLFTMLVIFIIVYYYELHIKSLLFKTGKA